jgi:hypothetical protein
MSPNNPLSIRGLSILEQVWVRFEHPEEASGGSEGYFIAVLVVSKLLIATRLSAKASEPLQGDQTCSMMLKPGILGGPLGDFDLKCSW